MHLIFSSQNKKFQTLLQKVFFLWSCPGSWLITLTYLLHTHVWYSVYTAKATSACSLRFVQSVWRNCLYYLKKTMWKCVKFNLHFTYFIQLKNYQPYLHDMQLSILIGLITSTCTINLSIQLNKTSCKYSEKSVRNVMYGWFHDIFWQNQNARHSTCREIWFWKHFIPI